MAKGRTEKVSEGRADPKFKYGQIVVMDIRGNPPFRIKGFRWKSGQWFYSWANKHFVAERLCRDLTNVELGIEG